MCRSYLVKAMLLDNHFRTVWLILNSNVRFSLLTAFGCIMLATLCHILNQVRLTMHMLAHLKCKYLSG